MPLCPELAKEKETSNCSKCGKFGHNARTCKGELDGNSKLNLAVRNVNQQKSHAPKLHISDFTCLNIIFKLY